jgi:pimeloyl-ACP methyl ester carboxylesterase
MLADVPIPQTMFTRVGGNRIAYQVVGEGPPDLLWLSGLGEPVDARWDYPPCASFVRRLASFSRLIMFDRRGVGASDPVPLESLPSWEGWADDATAVLDAVGSTRTIVLGSVQGGPTAIMFAATRPERTQALILAVTAARFLRADDYPWGETEEEAEAIADFLGEHWGLEDAAIAGFPSHADDPVFRHWLAKSCRMSCSAQEIVAYMRQDNPTDVRQILPSIQMPTLVLHRNEDPPFFKAAEGRYLAERIPGARFEVVPGKDLSIYTEPNAEILAFIEEFVTGTHPLTEPDRVLAAVLFTDIVGSTERVSEVGDSQWHTLLDRFRAVVREQLHQYRGREVNTRGDDFLAIFDGPARAIRCAQGIREVTAALGINVRSGLHTGEVELLADDDIGGIAVHIGARVAALAGAGEVLVSRTVTDLVAGSGITFEDRGDHELKGVPGAWRLYAVTS